MPEDDPAVGEVVEGQGVHRDRGRRAAGHLHDRGAEPDPGGLATPPGQRRERVGAPRLGGEDRVEAGLLGRRDQLADALRRLGAPVAELQPQFHRASSSSRLHLPQIRTCSSFASMPRTLSAPVTVAFDYTRSTGPVLGRFLSGLRDGVVVGGRTSEGKVVVPPPEYDPVTHAATEDFVEVADAGTVTSWTWVPEPVKGQPLDRPFAFVLVTLDGADAPLLHALDVASPDDVAHRHAGPDPLARRAGRGDHRHRVLRAAATSAARSPPGATGGRETRRPGHRDRRPDRARLPLRRLARRSRCSTPRCPRASSSASAARPARRSTSRRAAPARPTARRPRRRSSSPTPAR